MSVSGAIERRFQRERGEIFADGGHEPSQAAEVTR